MLEPVFTQEQLKMLNTPLKPNEIEHKQGMSYLKGQLAVVKANQIFGVGNWAYKQLGPIEFTDTGIKNSKGNTIYLVSATVELTVRGCETFVEQGDCEAQGMGAPAISMARKGAVTDGLKRCLKNFGAAFGLDLYFDTPPANTFNQPATTPTKPQVTQNRPQLHTPDMPPQPVRTVQQQQHPQQQQQPVTQAPPKPAPAPVANPKEHPLYKHYSRLMAESPSLGDLEETGVAIGAEVQDEGVKALLKREYREAQDRLHKATMAAADKFEGAFN